jgi:PilZ domain
MSTLAPSAPAAPRGGVDCRVWERFPCDLPTSCQPVAARQDRDIVWTGTLRDISVGGVGVVLQRRFEPGMGLAIELPGQDPNQAETLLARVVYVRRLPEGGWLLGCSFISQLSDSELDALLRLAESLRAPTNGHQPLPAASNKIVVENITLEGKVNGRTRQLKVKRLIVTGSFPPAPGTIWRVTESDKIRVLGCQQQANAWTVACEFVSRPSARH